MSIELNVQDQLQPQPSLTISVFQEQLRYLQSHDQLEQFACFLEDYIFKLKFMTRSRKEKVATHFQFMLYLLQIVVHYVNYPYEFVDFADDMVVKNLQQEYVIGGLLNIILNGWERNKHFY